MKITTNKWDIIKFIYEYIIIFGFLFYIGIAIESKVSNSIIHAIYGLLVMIFPFRHLIKIEENKNENKEPN